MKLKVKNFGKIQHAEVELNGLTVIAGKNDTGKSTIGKLFYAIVKTFAKYEDTYNRVVGSELFVTLFRLLGNILRGDNRKILIQNKDLFDVTESIYVKMDSIFTPSFMSNNLFNIEQQLRNTILSTIEVLKLIKFSPSYIQTELEDIYNALTVDVSKDDLFKESYRYYMKDSFLRNYNNSLNTNTIAEIEYFFEDSSNLKVEIKSNFIKVNNLDLDKKFPFYKDITFIDFPEIIDERFQHFNESNFNWTDDLLAKTKLLKSNKMLVKENQLGERFWSEVLDKSFFYLDNESNSFKYKVSNDASPLNIINIASGTKSFGILYLLIRSGIINEDTPIILDEPENHLHPEWQIAYAKFLVLLVKNGFKVLLTSHSPTFIQALLKEIVKEDKWNVSYKFYLADLLNDAKNNTTIRDVTNNPDEIFKNLVRPIEKMWSED